jgi:hypothetical protein
MLITRLNIKIAFPAFDHPPEKKIIDSDLDMLVRPGAE